MQHQAEPTLLSDRELELARSPFRQPGVGGGGGGRVAKTSGDGPAAAAAAGHNRRRGDQEGRTSSGEGPFHADWNGQLEAGATDEVGGKGSGFGPFSRPAAAAAAVGSARSRVAQHGMGQPLGHRASPADRSSDIFGALHRTAPRHHRPACDQATHSLANEDSLAPAMSVTLRYVT